MRYLAAAALALLLAASCGDSKPCTTCPNVMGSYHVVMDSKPADMSTCQLLYFDGGEQDIEIFQKGSALDAPALFGMKGTLYDDNGARFGPIKVRVTGADSTADVSVAGGFAGDEAHRTFSGSLNATAIIEGKTCTLTAPVRMTKRAPP
jgi:hypothetical protein